MKRHCLWKLVTQYPIIHNDFINPELKKNKILLIFDNNLSFETSEFSNNDFNKILIVNNEL